MSIRTPATRIGALAGLGAAALLDAYRLGVTFFENGVLPEDHYRTVAAGLLGGAAYALPGAAWLGVAMQLAAGAAVGVVFALTAKRVRAVTDHPLLSGTVLGLGAYVLERFVAAIAKVARPQPLRLTFFECVAHTIFFGIPLAYVVVARLRNA
jgi:xanthosine utilization system XapX-like protein